MPTPLPLPAPTLRLDLGVVEAGNPDLGGATPIVPEDTLVPVLVVTVVWVLINLPDTRPPAVAGRKDIANKPPSRNIALLSPATTSLPPGESGAVEP